MRIKNWSRFQHYKNSRGRSQPRWIKIYTELLNDPQWHACYRPARALLAECWLLASETDGILPEIDVICFRLRIDKDEFLGLLGHLSHWIEDIPDELLAECYQNASEPLAQKRREEKRRERVVVAKATTHSSNGVSKKRDDVDDAIDNWNTVAEALGLPTVRDRTASRRQKLAARLRDSGGLSGWNAALESLAAQPFLCGENKQSWRASFDWMVSPANFTKVREGVYKR